MLITLTPPPTKSCRTISPSRTCAGYQVELQYWTGPIAMSALGQKRTITLCVRIVFGDTQEDGNSPHRGRCLLCTRRERPEGHRSSENSDEIAPPHCYAPRLRTEHRSDSNEAR